ncbi:vacuolar protein sorting-associated protein 13D isoform D [Alligator mississippiensis]|uniref:Vacuolar protein sorting-associated protein 13D isoform D n=1 Tax=Alligator mississippiensis TaxID=8496 RepID=A0A151PJE3_ALLMI|nr:vacuolar protein sorting-associated protein 13D isoform D [Alligator mississippiensis]
MLEGLVAWVLNTYLGKYVNNLNTDQLSVALLKGAVELENLPLKKDALKELELPFEVKAGFIGKITLQIPFYRPHVDPWVISISKLHLIGAPEKQEDFDEEREKLLERERKKALLLSLEEKWKKERQQKGESYWYSVTASVVARIVENIELKIQDVHLRFEDGVTNPSQPFAFGICIKNVSMQNAINEPVEKLMRKKQLDVADFSIYWDTDCTLLGDLPPVDLQEAMDNSMESRDHNYIMEPVCTSALLKRNCSKEPLRSRQTPRLECDIQFETIPLKLSQMQYQQIMGFLKELDRKERQLKFRKWRPKVPVTGNCREWWIFALNANLSEIREQRQRSTWEFALRRAQDAASYTDMYYSKLRGDLLSPAEQAEMHRIEEEQTYEELKVLHEIVFDKFHELAESVKEPLSDSPGVTLTIQHSSSSGMLQYLQSWFPGWGGWYGETQQTYEGEPFERLLPESQEQWNPEDMLGADEFFDPAADASSMNTFTKRDHIFAKLNLQLQGGTVTLLHREKRTLHSNESAFMQLEFSGVKILAESLPRRNSSLLKIQLGGLFLRDLATEGTIFPLLVFPNPQKEVGCFSSVGLQTLSSEMTNQNTAADPDAPVFEMLYERNPAHSNFERRLEVSTRPLNIIYNPQAIKKVADFFYKGRVHTSGFGYQSELEARVAEAARRQYNKLKMQTKAEIRQTIDRLLVGEFIENSKCWSVCLDISAPQVIFPDDFKFVDPVLVVVDLGRILLTNSQDDSKKGGDDFSSEANELSDDEYKTPLATPPSTPPRKESSNSGIKASEYTGIMVGQVKDNWKHVQDSDLERRLSTSENKSTDILHLGKDKIFTEVDHGGSLHDSVMNLTQSVVTLEQHTREVFGTNAHFVKRPYDAENLSFDVPTGSLRDSRAQSPTCGPLEYQFVSAECPSMNLDSTLQKSFPKEKEDSSPQPLMTDLEKTFREQETYQTVRMTNGEKYGRKIATASIGGTKVNVSMCSSIGNTIRSLPDALSFTFTEQSKDECSLNLKMASLHYNHSAKFLKELTLSMDELEENFRSMLKSAATKVTTVLATKTADSQFMNKKEATCEMTHGLHPSSGPGSIGSQEESHFTRHDFFKSLHKGHAFHILNNTTIQFQLEKIPLERDLNLTFPLSNEDFEISSIMRIEGKFVNPLQVVLAKHVYEQVQLSGDLTLGAQDSMYKNLMVSRGAPKPSSLAHKEYLSQSCPSVSNVEYPDMPRSLPSHMEEAPNVFQSYQRPMCAPLHINIFLVDKKHPEFSSRYNKINRSVDVDFNCLDVLITLQTWVVILDFFGIGSTADNHAMKVQPEDVQQTVKSEANILSTTEVQDPVNTKLDLKVHSLSLVLNKTTSELAKANVSKLVTYLELIDGDLSVHGSIGSLSLSDLTSHGEFYRERFTTSGEEALIFQIYKYGRPDPLLQRDCDIRISLRMASVQYVHTQRFQAEVVSFIQHFTQLQDVLGRQRAAIEGQTVRDKAQRASRVVLDIEAGAPVLLIPESSKSNHLIVANLGKLKVKNKFLFAGSPGTFSLKDKDSAQFSSPLGTPKHGMKKVTSTDEPRGLLNLTEGLFMKSSSGTNIMKLKNEPVLNALSKQQGQQPKSPVVPIPDSPEDHVCLLDCIVVDLQDMDIFAAERYPREGSKAVENTGTDLIFPSYFVRQAGGSLLTEPFRLKLKVERNLDKEISHAVPDISIHGNLSSVHCSLDLSKYKLIRGLLENNLGEPTEEFMRPYDLQDPRIHTVLSGEVYTSMTFLIDMVNVSLELMDPKGKDGRSSLARFDFKKSKLLFESFSNQAKSVNLVSHSMMAFDTRYPGQKSTLSVPNVFNCIFQSSRNTANQGAIQIELHFRSTKDSSCFTVVLNNLRVFLIFDWLFLVHDFLHTPSDFKKQDTVTPSQQRSYSSEMTVLPKAVKSGVVTKRSSLQASNEKQLEVRINVTGTEFVVVEDMSCFDTSAIILKGTTVLTYKPKLLDRPFSGSFFGIEVFSCRLGNEQDTALSIIDPVQIQMELIGNSAYPSGSGLLDAFNSEDFPPVLEIQLQALNIRLSYNDVQLFLAIAKSIPQQTSAAVPDSSISDAESAASNLSSSSWANETLSTFESKEASKHTLDPVLEVQLARLQELGFSMDDCRKALLICQGQLKKAASWLFKNAEPLKSISPASRRDSQGAVPVQFVSGVEIKAESICICFIDDCMDCDVPLAELTFSRLNFLQHVRANPEGYAHFTLSGDYYNRELSGWEPFIEPWPCSVSWQQQAASRLHPSRLKLEVKARHRLDINITSVLLEQYTCTKQSWMADYCKQDKEEDTVVSEDWMGSSVDPPCFGQTEMKTPKRRQPFVPFALRNHTGCTLWFATLTTTPTRAALSHSGSPGVVSEENGTLLDDAHNVSEWREVLTGEEIPFEFEARGKLRHRHTHDLRIHQLQVRVSGWEQVNPVSVDKVGIFFRYAAPDKNTSSSTVGSPISRTNIIHPHVYFSSLPPVRVVFEVTMEGSARKVITVRSALIVKNRLETPMELRLDSPSAPDKPVVLPSVMPGDSLAIPLHLTSWRLQARPKGMGVFFCKTPIHWTNVQKAAEVCSSKRECHSMENENSRFFRFCVAIKKENYPDYMPSNIFSDSAKQIFRQPGHIIYLLPTVVICNLLPCELEFYVKGMPINGTLKPGKEAALHTADTSQNIELGVSLENFPICKELLIPPGTQNYMVRMRLYDVNKRLLNLTIRIVCRAEGSLKIFIAAPYWLINKTGLPLIFRQDNAKTDAAGQFEEHELARSLSPLLFCYADKEQPNLCTMRIGKGIHPEGMPGWCQGFSLDGGSGVRALKVIQHGNRPGLIYNIGIDVKKGRGRYIDTCLVTFAPRYLLDNKSTHKLAFAQREFARGQGTSNPDGYISTLPGSSVVFHWPRNDYDQLLCVRLMDVPNCIWSGGFEVNKNNSFHINMRDTLGKCYFLRVEITLRGATYRVSFSDTDQLPPPFRVDNFSKVPVVFIQHSVAEPRLCTEVKSMTSLDYAWDEPTLPPFILLAVKGAGSSEITCSMNDFQDGKQLYYENFIYIAATHTFSGLQEGTGRPVASNKDVAYAELVLDVSPKTQRVILKKKEPGKRSQLWRMTGIGMLCHEGSSVPHNPNKPSPPRSVESCLILDIAGLAAVTDNRYEPLMLRKADRRRSTTQTWSFRDGKLTCGIHGLVVQAKGGMSGLYDGAEVVLGPDTSLEVLGPVPPEQQFINQKMRPGSGVLAVRVIPDGPTRVLQITDFNQRRNDRLSCEGEDSPVTEQDLRKLKNPDTEQELEVLVKLEGGLGLSLVNKIPEELIFASLTGINVHYTHLSSSQVLELSVQDVQVDNQLIGTTQPFMLFLTPIISENKAIETGPAVQLNAMKFPSKNALTDIYKHLMITARRFTVQIEEKLLLKLLSFFGYDQSESEVEKYDENLHEKTLDQGGAQKRYYFENLKISVPQIKLSVFTSNKLPLDLKALKSTLGFPLIRFEDAVINLDPFTRVHPYETKEFIINDILKHFQEELLSQAARILGSVDFLGNPMGLLNDVSEGVTGLIKYGNVGGLIRNVTHGVSNSAAKFAGTLSDGLGKTMDNRHQTEREYIRYHAATSGEHLVAGIQGLAHGIIGGLTSVITSTVEGVKTEGGVSGFMSGLGKGLVGTVTKPVAGALDFASETAQAVRDTATLSGPRTQAERVRKPRCCRNPQGLLPRYSESQAEGQEQLFKLTDNIQDEFFIVVENIDSYCVLISSKAVYFLKRGDYVDRDAIFLEVKYDDLYHCLVSKDHGKVYVQLTKKAVSTSSGVAIPGPSHHKPMVHNSWSWTPENITLPAKGNLLYTLAISAAGSRCIVIDQKCHLHLSQQIHPAFVTLLGTYGTRHKDADALRETYWKQCCIQLKMLYYLVFSFSPSVENRTACSLPT